MQSNYGLSVSVQISPNSHHKHMSILSDIANWIDGKPQFWQTALDRLVRNGILTPMDLDQIVAICKTEYGLSNATFSPVDLTSLKAYVAHTISSDSLFLSKIHGVQNISALSGSSSLEFAHSGLTVIYGDNGAGKSSYVSILKHACNTRGQKPTINGNVYDASSSSVDKKATVEYSKDGNTFNSVTLHNATVSDISLKGVDVFDSLSATHYIAGEDEIAFVPHGLALIEKFALALAEVESKLNSELQSLELSKLDYSLLQVDSTTLAHSFLIGLNSNSTRDQIRAGSQWSVNKDSRVEELKKLILEVKATDPQKLLELNKAKIARFTTLRNRFEVLEKALIGADVLDHAKKTINDFITATETLSVSSENNFSSLSLTCVGGATWKQLWESARKFYNESNNASTFPDTQGECSCPLCLQPLGEDAKKRFLDFESFVKHDAQKNHDKVSAVHSGLVLSLNSLSFDYSDFEPTVLEIEYYKSDFNTKQSQYLGDLDTQRKFILEKLQSKTLVTDMQVPVLAVNAKELIDGIILEIESENKSLGESSVEEKLTPFEKELNELVNEKKIHEFKPKLAREVFRQKKHSLLKSGISNCATRSVTVLSNQLTSKYITQNLQNAFKDELTKFGFKNVIIETGTKGVRGKQHHYLKLGEPHAGSAALKDILSEGEHRCIAVSTFLSELTLSDHKSTIVFDDPVSSLDHKWRNKIAKRIVEESQFRQVIVFTHDIAFLLMLDEYCEKQTRLIDIKGLTRKAKETGIISPNPPWDALKVSKRLGLLKDACQKLDKIERTQTEEAYKIQAQNLYGKLRETWERCVEEVVLNGAIQRFGREVQTQRLAEVIDLTQTDYTIIDNNMSKCSTYFVGHDSAGTLNDMMPNAAEVLSDVMLLESFVSDIKKRRKKN